MQNYGIPLKDDRISPIFYNFAHIINKKNKKEIN